MNLCVYTANFPQGIHGAFGEAKSIEGCTAAQESFLSPPERKDRKPASNGLQGINADGLHPSSRSIKWISQRTEVDLFIEDSYCNALQLAKAGSSTAHRLHLHKPLPGT
jgi:hypothetical protein